MHPGRIGAIGRLHNPMRSIPITAGVDQEGAERCGKSVVLLRMGDTGREFRNSHLLYKTGKGRDEAVTGKHLQYSTREARHMQGRVDAPAARLEISSSGIRGQKATGAAVAAPGKKESLR